MPTSATNPRSTATDGDHRDGSNEVVKPVTRRAALLVIGQSLLILVPLVVLGAAIDWPGSLDDPAEIALPRMLENEGAVRVGYLVYLLYSVLFLPVAIIVYRWLRTTGSRNRNPATTVGMQVAIGMAAASALARSIGIVRWLSTMLPMAERWEVASATERTVLAAQFTSLNDYGGTIGEILGVSVFAAIWLAVTTVGGPVVRSQWISRTGAAVALLLLAPAVELAGVDAGPIVSVSSSAITLWLLVVGIAMFRSVPTTTPTRTAHDPDPIDNTKAGRLPRRQGQPHE